MAPAGLDPNRSEMASNTKIGIVGGQHFAGVHVQSPKPRRGVAIGESARIVFGPVNPIGISGQCNKRHTL